jgi:ferrous iron transport protein A
MASTLDHLAIGSRATILRVEGDDHISTRLMEMGLIDGATIQVLGAAPFGDPREYLVRGFRISLRSSEARRITIQTS